MSGYRWSSLLLLSFLLLLTGCQSSESSRFAWNPFRRTADKANPEKGDSPLDLPKFASRKSESQRESGTQSPVAEEQVDRLLADGQAALQEERFDDARLAYNEVLSASPDNATAHHGLAMAADLTEQWADAEYHYRQALRIRPRDANLLCDIGYSYLLQNRYAEAARYLNHAIEVNPQHESAQMNLALLDLRQGNREAAENRVISMFGSGTQAMQIMSQLESQTTAVTAAFKADAAKAIPSNATLEQVQEIARQERLEAERRRASKSISQGAAQPANQLNPQPLMPQVQNEARIASETQVVSNRNGLPVAAGYDANTGLPISIPGARHAELASRSGGQFQNGQTLDNGVLSNPLMESSAFGQGLDSHGSGIPQHSALPGNSSTSGHGVSSTTGVGISHGMMNSAPGNGGSSMMGAPTANLPVNTMPVQTSSYANNELSRATNSTSVSAPQPSGLNSVPARVVPIHSSGAFQTPPSGGVSYGQPLGFNSPSTTATYQPPAPPASGALTSATPLSLPPVYLEGLNAGPGAIFPVSGSAAQAIQPTPSPASGGGAAGLNMNNISSPGTNSMVNGAMYEQPGSVLPSQDWGNQQQQQLRAQQLQSQRWQEQQSMGRWPVSQPQQDLTSWGAGSHGVGPVSRPAAVNPLEAYEKQRQQLDSEYNRTLQQLDRRNTSTMPQF